MLSKTAFAKWLFNEFARRILGQKLIILKKISFNLTESKIFHKYFFKDPVSKTLSRYFTERLFNELLFTVYKHPLLCGMKWSCHYTNLATINIFQNFLGKKFSFKNLFKKSKENMNMKEQNQTTAILVGLNKFNKI